MKIKHNNKDYELNVEKAIKDGYLKEIKYVNLQLSQDEVAVLYCILGHIGGPPSGTRGCVDSTREKIENLFGDAEPYTDLDLTFTNNNGAIYFER